MSNRAHQLAPTFVVKGNWDAWYWHGIDLFGQTGAQELDGNSVKLEVRGLPIWVTGIAVENAMTSCAHRNAAVAAIIATVLLGSLAWHFAWRQLAFWNTGAQITIEELRR